MADIDRNSWVDSDEIAKALASLKVDPDYNSKTLTFDQSHPPTPDGSGRPTNFQIIAPGLYRSSYPLFAHFDKLEDLCLKTIVTLVPDELPFTYGNFISSHGITHYHIPILANKTPEVFTDADTVKKVLELMLDPNNYPMLIHCNKGKHRTGCVTACFRKVCGWTDEAVIEEYVRYSAPKDRELDKIFIKRFDPTSLKPLALNRGYVGGVYKQPMVGDTSISERSVTTSYTNNSISTYSNDETGEVLHDYQERVRRENNNFMESAYRWSHR